MQALGVISRPASLRPRHLQDAALPLAIVVGMATAVATSQFVEFESQWVWRIGYPALFMLGVIGAVAMVLPIPILPLVFAGGSFLDPSAVAMSAAAGMTVGMALSYIAGTLGHGPVARLLNDNDRWYAKWIHRARNEYQRRTVVSSLVIAAVPNPVYSYSGIITGSMRISMRRFCFGTFMGKTIQAMIVAFAGFYTAGNIPALF
jgi:membrane protein DedA with SNARE-associated domain